LHKREEEHAHFIRLCSNEPDDRGYNCTTTVVGTVATGALGLLLLCPQVAIEMMMALMGTVISSD
jgi:hypothetical protein